ncbi:hypothetical protein AK812_SmicGene36275 [Symbiodinium microadriaticum]|uniref:Uncharacterized protein n=1 Tax=Symbiodinium microadriaticum TaxID=2951 RepID=A0A1Q9CJA8_SYMMI|nr:hypothetical protein AK812_SmicGene36275 [Symbiodinium microadriaticum]
MESLFDFAHGAGGWAAANRLAQVLLQRHESYLNGAEQQKAEAKSKILTVKTATSQAQHILTTTQHGCLSGRVGTEIASAHHLVTVQGPWLRMLMSSKSSCTVQACPACGAPADFLALSCDSCHAVQRT